MKIGTVYPQTELRGDPSAVVAFAEAAESLGYSHLVMYDHVVGASLDNRTPSFGENARYTDRDPFHEPLVTFAYLAGITKHLLFTTGVLVLPQRQTVLVAKQCADVALYSGGRLRIGVGTGWNHVEYSALGKSFESRGPRLSEQIGFLRRLWSEPLVTFDGKFDAIERASILPRPSAQIPILCGGFSTPAYRRAAKLADGFIFAGPFEESVLPGWQEVRRLLGEAGRAAERFEAEIIVVDQTTRGLDIREAVDVLCRWRDAGGTHGSISSMGRGFTRVEQHIDHLAEARNMMQGAGFI